MYKIFGLVMVCKMKNKQKLWFGWFYGSGRTETPGTQPLTVVDIRMNRTETPGTQPLSIVDLRNNVRVNNDEVKFCVEIP